MNDYEILEEGDLVIYEDPNCYGRKTECRVRRIHLHGDRITPDTIVTIMDKMDNAYDVYACELKF